MIYFVVKNYDIVLKNYDIVLKNYDKKNNYFINFLYILKKYNFYFLKKVK